MRMSLHLGSGLWISPPLSFLTPAGPRPAQLRAHCLDTPLLPEAKPKKATFLKKETVMLQPPTCPQDSDGQAQASRSDTQSASPFLSRILPEGRVPSTVPPGPHALPRTARACFVAIKVQVRCHLLQAALLLPEAELDGGTGCSVS